MAEVSSVVLLKMKTVAEGYLGQEVKHAIVPAGTPGRIACIASPPTPA